MRLRRQVVVSGKVMGLVQINEVGTQMYRFTVEEDFQSRAAAGLRDIADALSPKKEVGDGADDGQSDTTSQA